MNEGDLQNDAEKIRMKRLAKLQNSVSVVASDNVTSPSGSNSAPPVKVSANPKPAPALNRPLVVPPDVTSALKKKSTQNTQKFNLQNWVHQLIEQGLKVTLDRRVAEQSSYDIVWLKYLATELESEGFGEPASVRLSGNIVDRLLITRLELNPQTMTDDLDYLPFLVSMPAQQTTFEYLVGSWRRLCSARLALLKKGYLPVEVQQAMLLFEKVRDLVISYTGFILQDPEMFPQPTERPLGPPELVGPLLSMSALSAPLLASSASSSNVLTPIEVEPFLQDLARRFEPDNEIDNILAPVVRLLLFHESLWRLEGLAGGDAGWRSVITGLETLVSIKSIAVMITRMEDWLPPSATAATFERVTLMGPLCRLNVFSREWPSIAQTYFSDPGKRSHTDIESSSASLRGTLKSLQSSLCQVFSALVRASPESREAVLQYFARAVALNVKRTGLQVDPATVSSDSFMVNLQIVMLHLAEPIMDVHYTKMDRIDSLYYARSTRINLKEETRINATSDEAAEWVREIVGTDGTTPPNFTSEIFYLTLALSHFGLLQAIRTYEDLGKQLEDVQRHLEVLQGDGSWMGSPFQARTEAALNAVKAEMSQNQAQQLAFRVQLLDPELVFRSMAFITFVSTWLIRQAEPNKKHPTPPIVLPLPQEVPNAFRILPEYILEDIVDYLLFVLRYSPESFNLSDKDAFVVFALTFLTSTWYIKNPFLKAKINEMLFIGVIPFDRDRNTVFVRVLNENDMALKHLMSALMHFYIEVEQTGASSQFYDKFNARRNIAYILKAIWNNPVHRESLKKEALNVDKFVRFINLMINDVTYLMDESLSELAQIHNLQVEMRDMEGWMAQPAQTRREREATLRQLERHASGYTMLGRSTVELLKDFTGETKAPFMMPEIVHRLAAMLDYNLDALVGPKCQELKVKDPEKYKFDAKRLLSDILQIFLNLSDQEEFIKAVAADGRSYRKELFGRAGDIALKRALKSEAEVWQLRAFVEMVEQAKSTLEADDDLGDVPDEFLDPLMYTLMRDPVLLPSSRTVVDRATIKSHLLSDSKDPFNRAPLKIEDITPDLELKARIESFLHQRRSKKDAAQGEMS